MAGGLFCSSGGCTAKLGPDILERVLSRIERGAPDKTCWSGLTAAMTLPFTASAMTWLWCRLWISFRQCWKILMCLARSRPQMR